MLLGIDQGTSGTTVIAFAEDLHPHAQAYRPVQSQHPQVGWVEQDPEAILQSVVEAVAEVCSKVGSASVFKAAGLANQGESLVAWDARTQQAITPVIVWSDRRASPLVEELKAGGHAPRVRELTGLELSDYFCAAKYAWLLKHNPEVQSAAEGGYLRLGTLEAWMALRLGGHPHQSDHSTASRTQLLGLDSGEWEAELLEIFGVPSEALPEVRPSLSDWGYLEHPDWRGPIPWFASLVDQPAALAGNGCTEPGSLKVTYGTGCFVLVNAGDKVPHAGESLLASVAWSSPKGRVYALDGGVFTAATAVNWLVSMGLAGSPEETAALAESVSARSVRFLPAFTGLGAPWWDSRARGVFSGLTAGTTKADLVRAVLESIAFRVRDVVEAMWASGQPKPEAIKVDGGLTKNPFLMQFQADLLGIPLEIAAHPEATALGAALLAGSSAGLLDLEQIPNPSAQQVYEPRWSRDRRDEEYRRWLGWLQAVRNLPS